MRSAPVDGTVTTRSEGPHRHPLAVAGAARVVVEIGGALSHAGIVAREHGLPCVANVEGVMQMLRDGDVVRIDGSSGVASVLSPAEAPAVPTPR